MELLEETQMLAPEFPFFMRETSRIWIAETDVASENSFERRFGKLIISARLRNLARNRETKEMTHIFIEKGWR